MTIANFEAEKHGHFPSTLSALRAAFDAAGLEFIEDGGGSGVRLREGHQVLRPSEGA